MNCNVQVLVIQIEDNTVFAQPISETYENVEISRINIPVGNIDGRALSLLKEMPFSYNFSNDAFLMFDVNPYKILGKYGNINIFIKEVSIDV